MQKINNTTGSGVILYKKFSDGHKVLVLTSANGMMDIPKGHKESTDLNYFSTAQRECFEETQIFFTQADLLTKEIYQDKNLVIFCASTEQEPTILINPKTQVLEHSSFGWLFPSDAMQILPPYLEKAVKWSIKFYNDN